MQKVKFNYQKPVQIRQATILKRIIQRLFRTEGRKLQQLSYVFCSDDYILNINRQFLQHDFYTDIISFDLSGSAELPLDGEIYVSVDTVRSNASSFGVPFHEELRRVILHGPLHFCGYQDKTVKAKQIMRSKEDEYLKLFNAATKRST